MKIRAIAPWFGGKRNMADRIVEQLGPHKAYWEPFCGSLAVLFAKPVATMETVNDLNGDLINLARVVQDDSMSIRLFERCHRTLCAEDNFIDLAGVVTQFAKAPAAGPPNLDRAYAYFVTSWLGRNGVAGTESYNQGFCRRFTKNGGHAATRWTSAIESIPDWWERLRAVTILNDDAFSILERIEDAEGVVIYCDPPYIEKGAKYVHDFKADEHARLAKLLDRFQKTRVVLSYYDHPSLAAMYPDWDRKSIEVSKSLANQNRLGKTGGKLATEVLLTNDRTSLFMGASA